jgi:PPOX class probable F420-dependent enzyme
MAAQHAITPAVRAFLEGPHFAVLATVAGSGAPRQTVMWYLIDGDEILFNTKRGRFKQRDLERDPRVSLCVADGYRYVTIRGAVRVSDDPAVTQADIKRLATRYYGPEKAQRQVDSGFGKEERISYRVPLDDLLIYGFDK